MLIGTIALCLFAALQRSQRAPSPVTYCLVLGTLMLAARLTLEKTAAPAGLVWATGTTPAQPLILFFVGVFSAQRGFSFGRFLLALIVLAILQRAIISGVGLAATLGEWGTHLDVNSVSAINTPLGGLRRFAPGDAIDKWTWAILVPQMVIWVGLTVVTGLVLGGIALRINRA